MAWNTGASVFYLLCNWLTTVLVVRLGSGYSASGVLAMAMSVGNVISAIALFRIRPVQVADPVSRSGAYIAAHLVTCVAAVAFGVAYVPLTGSLSALPAIVLYCGLKLAEAVIDCFQGIDQRASRLDVAGVSQLVRGVLVLGGFVLGLAAWNSLEASLALMLAGTLAVLLLFDVPMSKRLDDAWHVPTVDEVAGLLRGCLPGFLASLLCTMAVSLVRQRYGVLYGDDALGIYAALSAPVTLIQAFSSFVYAPLYGPMAELWDRGDGRAIRGLVARALVLMGALGVVGALLALLVGGQVITLVYGVDMGAHWELLYLMVVSTVLTAVQLFLVDLLIVMGKGHLAAVASAVTFLASVAGSCALLSADQNSVSVVLAVGYSMGIICSIGLVCAQTRREKGDW